MNRNWGTNGIGMAVVVALFVTAGVAVAMQSKSVPVPAGQAWIANANFIPGGEGATFGTPGLGEDKTWEWSVGVGTDGTLSINGMVVGSCMSAHPHTLVVLAHSEESGWYVDISVTDEVTHDVVGSVAHHHLSGPAASVDGAAQVLSSLTVQ